MRKGTCSWPTRTQGIDGLVLHGSDLIAVQNGFRPHRVVRLRLDIARERITAVEILERNHPEFDEPTLGVVVDGAFYYVANSQTGRATPGGRPATTGPLARYLAPASRPLTSQTEAKPDPRPARDVLVAGRDFSQVGSSLSAPKRRPCP
jgi:hypothetical protein